ncbi:hypothetical protein BGX21_011521 [Mortierella sp. AD011]|nr:hypothetical protein BGX20_011491 [Mortierella sp. AD010]KAF9390230.1 hypothetical protein BGX21_011521 [Mortierella sp. AD011]
MSPVSRQAKLVHLIGYVDRQRELLSSEDETDEPQQPVVERQHELKQRSVPDALDPCLALPRALPRKMISSSNLSLYRDTFYNDADIGNDFMPLSQRRLITFDRPIVFRAQVEDDFELQRRPLMRQPTVQSMDRSIKPGRLGGFSSFLTKGRRQHLRHQGSYHTLQRKSFDDCDTEDRSRFHVISYKSGRVLKPAKMSSSGDSETQSDDLIKPRSTVKQMFLDVFKKSSGKPGPEAATGSYREEQLHPEFLQESYDKQERQLFNLWSPPHVVAADDDDDEEEESSSSDQSPRTIQTPWTPDSPSSSTTLRHSASFNRLFPYLDDCSKVEDEGDNQKTLEPSDQLVPISNLIRELAAFGLDYVNHNSCSNQRTEQANDFQSAGNYVVAAM